MDAVFLKLVNMSISAAWVVGIVLILRLVLKRAPKWIHCLLWGLVAIRLICPFSMESMFSLLPSGEVFPSDVITSGDIQVHTGFEAVDTRINSGVLESYMEGVTVPVGNTANVLGILSLVWCVGMLLMAAYAVFSFVRLKRKVAASVETVPNVRICDYIESPFILGIRKPVVYLPTSMPEAAAASVLAHEQAHIRRKDHWWKPLGYLLLMLHWFNPVMWLAYVLLCRDIEMACDEKVIREMDTAGKKQYSESLLACSMPRYLIAACPLAFGEVGVKDRVRSVLNYKKPAFWIILVAVIACIAVAVCFLTDPAGATLARKWNVTAADIGGTVLTAGEDVYTFIEKSDVDNIISFLKEARIEALPISQSRSEDRAKNYSIRLSGETGELIFYFDSDFTDVWVDDGVKPSLSYRLEEPGQARGFFEAMLNIDIPEAVSGGPDENGNYYFLATVLRTAEKSILVEPMEGCWERGSSDMIWVSLIFQTDNPVPEIRAGDRVKVVYNGMVAETYPAQVDWVYDIQIEERAISDESIRAVAAALGTDDISLFDYNAIGEITVLGCEYNGKLGIVYLENSGAVTVVDQETLAKQAGAGGILQDTSKGLSVFVISDPDAMGLTSADGDYYRVMNYPGLVVIDEIGTDVYIIGDFVAGDTPENAAEGSWVSLEFGQGDRIAIPPDWEYTLEAADGMKGVSFWPVGESEGKITLQFMESFAVCGTGLEQKSVRLGDYYGTAGYYDGNKRWSYLVLPAPQGKYVITRDGTCDWWDARYDALMDILSTMELACVVTMEEVTSTAEEMGAYLDYETVYAEFDTWLSCWLVHFYRDDGKTLVTTVKIDLLGNYLGTV